MGGYEGEFCHGIMPFRGRIKAFEDHALCVACSNGNVQDVMEMLCHGVDVNARRGEPLGVAVFKRHIAVVKLLLDHGADIHADEDNALFVACSHGYADIAELLLDRGADVNSNHRVLAWAVMNDHLDIVKLLVERGACLWTFALCCAAENGNFSALRLLVSYGATLSFSQKTGKFSSLVLRSQIRTLRMYFTLFNFFSKEYLFFFACCHNHFFVIPYLVSLDNVIISTLLS